ncbi:Regulatory protein alcR [Penicillium chermesinum]|uniref:Regulatory protein alcR n=1 Tax=Penicillium chermesinum TaxID=63820 RepID=A0A9W9NZ34_9EURO|nr:Regulatory protein alcR [Penicillium chermesinum]KAJ5232367.1 Regulatory protein alcR [Penicillium chermesinum]
MPSSAGAPRRSQDHSCDQCRKGKRRCDAPKNSKEMKSIVCSNCVKYRKECTFKWLSMRTASKRQQRRLAVQRPAATGSGSQSPYTVPSEQFLLAEVATPSQWQASSLRSDCITPPQPQWFCRRATCQ